MWYNNIKFKEILYSSGDVFLPDKFKKILMYDIIGSHKNTFYVSGWSIIHFMSGLIFSVLYLFFNFNIKNYFKNLFILHTCWELWQILIGMSKPYKITGSSNIIDTIIDTVLFMISVYIVKVIYNSSNELP